MEKERLIEMSRFVMVGLLATAIQYLVYYLLLGHMSASMAFTLGYVVSFMCNYVLSSRFTFRVETSFQRFVSFGLSHATNYFIQIILLNIFIGIGISEPLAPLPVYALATPINFTTVRFALTRSSREGDGYRLFLLVVGFAMLWLNLMDVPTMSDDMIYRFLWHADEAAPVETINGLDDLFRSQWAHYLSTNGRLVPHLLVQAFLVFLPSVVMQVVDTLMFVLLIHLTASWVTNDHRQRLLAAVVACTLLFVVFCGLRTTILWGLGAVNYLWTLVAVLSLLLFLRRSGGHRLTVAYVLLSPLALLAGWTHEALSLPVSIAFATWIVVNRRHLADKPVALLYMLLFMMGTACILLSPALWQRAGEAANLQSRLINGAMNCVANIRVTWLLALALLVMWRRCRGSLRVHLSDHKFEYVALVAALGIVLVCGVHLERVAFFTDFIAMLLLMRIIIYPPSFLHLQASSLTPLIMGCCVLLLLAYIPAYMVRSENVETWRLAEQQMKEPGRELIAVNIPRKGENKVMDCFREHYVNSSFEFGFYCSYMAFDAEDINMRCAARLYGKKRLTFLPEDVVRRIEGDSTAYADYELDCNKDLFVWRMKDERPVTGVTFVLNEEDVSQLLPHQRLVAYQGDEYELDDFKYEVVHVCGHPYLVFTKPTTNIFRRIRTIDIKH